MLKSLFHDYFSVFELVDEAAVNIVRLMCSVMWHHVYMCSSIIKYVIIYLSQHMVTKQMCHTQYNILLCV